MICLCVSSIQQIPRHSNLYSLIKLIPALSPRTARINPSLHPLYPFFLLDSRGSTHTMMQRAIRVGLLAGAIIIALDGGVHGAQICPDGWAGYAFSNCENLQRGCNVIPRLALRSDGGGGSTVPATLSSKLIHLHASTPPHPPGGRDQTGRMGCTGTFATGRHRRTTLACCLGTRPMQSAKHTSKTGDRRIWRRPTVKPKIRRSRRSAQQTNTAGLASPTAGSIACQARSNAAPARTR